MSYEAKKEFAKQLEGSFLAIDTGVEGESTVEIPMIKNAPIADFLGYNGKKYYYVSTILNVHTGKIFYQYAPCKEE